MPDKPVAGAPATQAWCRMLRISTAHLHGNTLWAAERWGRDEEKAPVPAFGPHPFGFYCAVPNEAEAADLWGMGAAPDDLLVALDWARHHGAEFVSFDADAPRCAALPDFTSTHHDRFAREAA
jgi:hypothetical protein